MKLLGRRDYINFSEACSRRLLSSDFMFSDTITTTFFFFITRVFLCLTQIDIDVQKGNGIELLMSQVRYQALVLGHSKKKIEK